MNRVVRWFDRASDLLRWALRTRLARGVALLFGVLAVIAVWASSLWFVPHLHSVLSEGGVPSARVDISSYGSIGDMFGAVNALFSGLALGAIALTLWLEARSRREARKPLVVGGIDSTDTTIGRPKRRGNDVFVPLRVPVKWSNQTADAALNVSGKLRLLLASKVSWKVGLDGPLLREADQDTVFEVELAEAEWGPILTELTSQRPVEMELTTIYRSLEGVDWMTVVTYIFSVRTTDQHYGLLDAVRNGTWSDEGVWQVDALVPVSARIKQGSWDHRLR